MLKVEDGGKELTFDGSECPQCRSGNICYGNVSAGVQIATSEVTCQDCGCGWELHFNLETVVVTLDGSKTSNYKENCNE